MRRDLESIIVEHRGTVDALRGDADLLRKVADTLVQAVREGKRIYIAGNGGSAADAQHIAAELVGRFKHQRRPIPAIALTTDTSILTAVGNDFSIERIFVRQIEALIQPGDVLWVLSVSGTSPNILAAVALAKEQGAKLIAFTGRSGGRLADACPLCLRADHDASDRVQEVHELAYHVVCEWVESEFL